MKRTFRQIILLLLLIGSAQWSIAQTNNDNSNYFLHTVTKGQGLYSISRMYNVTEADIIQLNPGSDVVIKVGQQLRIPQKRQVNIQGKDSKAQFHTIKTGETLYRLTVIYGLSAKEICAANPGLSAENFKVGQVIIIPPKETANVPLSSEPKITEPNPLIGRSLQANTQGQSSKSSNCKREYKVGRKENIYRISRQFGITELELINANPELKTRKLRRGEIICIPYSKEENKRQQQIVQDQAITPNNDILFAELKEEAEPINQINVAIILPFALDTDSLTDNQQKMVEYYEGFLLALDSLKKLGVSIDLYTYDSGDQYSSIAPILRKPEMRKMNIIFGPLYEKQISEAATFSDTTGIKVVLPFARKIDEVFTNPHLFQVNTSQSYFYSEVHDHFFRQFKNPNVLFFESLDEADDPYAKSLMQELDFRNISYAILPADTATNKDTIQSRLVLEKENILMLTSSKSGSLNNMVPIFQLLVRDTASTKFDIHLFGYPQYQVYTHNHLASFYEIDTYFYSSFYTNNLLPQATNFHKLFRRTYSKEIINRYPKYAMLGFDTGFYFLYALHLYGSEMEHRLQDLNYDPIQTGFKFERVNNWGGFINRKVFFIHMSKDYMLQKIDFD